MNSIHTAVLSVTARGAALTLCVLWLPVWFAQAVAALVGSDVPRSAPAPRLWGVVRGDLAFVGPTGGDAPRGLKSGLVSPAALRRRMGIGHVNNVGEDARFFTQASPVERIGLLARYALACVLSADGTTDANETRLFGVRIDALSMPGAVDRIIAACDAKDRQRMEHVAFVNPDCLNKAMRDRDYHYMLNRADLVLPDGSGLRIAGKLLGLPLVDNVNGTDLFPLLCEKAAQTGKKLFLFGGRPGVALATAERMRASYPGLQIVGCLDGYSHREQPDAAVRAINASGADIVLAGLGAPHQERWLLSHRDALNAAVGIGVGGLFDYYSGRINRAPLWLREIGLEWTWRILQEPGAKWRRYVFGNPLFLARVMQERWLRRQLPVGNNASRLPTPGEWVAGDAARVATRDRPVPTVSRRWRWALIARSLLKRALDVSVAGGALLALSPLLLATAAIIRLESPGPVLFRQERVGRRGRTFAMLKFRSMFVDAEARLAELTAKNESAGGVLFKIKDDPRITQVGKIIRRYSIDELPQLINVMRGEMSIVGPRPALPSEVEKYTAAERKRLQTNPGLTCLWQIGGRSDLSFEQQVELDVDYLKQQNVLIDLGIIAKTVPAVINGKGAY
ncbi:MAG: WecB/TagA/CpsF family glycosyltransferase [Gammaproteobacteria bacterium]|nr:WecB/TagA/CpsF family glycosyltransferase [Gammaproteobacteria bacterium]